MNANFDQMLKLEDEIRTATATAGFGVDLNTRFRGQQHADRLKKELYGLVRVLSNDEFTAYGEYRQAARRAQELTNAL